MEEYALFDPYREYLRPPLLGLRLQDGLYQRIPLEPDGGLVLRTASVKLLPETDRLRMIDAATGERLPWPDEEAALIVEAKAQIAEAQAQIAKARAQARAAEERARADRESRAGQEIEERILALEEELSLLRGGHSRQQ